MSRHRVLLGVLSIVLGPACGSGAPARGTSSSSVGTTSASSASSTSSQDSSSSSGSVAGWTPGPTSSAPIGPAGGTIVSADGLMTLAIPPGAVSAETPINITTVTSAPWDGGTGPYYECGPNGLVFPPDNPAMLTYHYQQADLIRWHTWPGFVALMLVSADGSVEEVLQSLVDPDAGTITWPVPHFTSAVPTPTCTISSNTKGDPPALPGWQ